MYGRGVRVSSKHNFFLCCIFSLKKYTHTPRTAITPPERYMCVFVCVRVWHGARSMECGSYSNDDTEAIQMVFCVLHNMYLVIPLYRKWKIFPLCCGISACWTKLCATKCDAEYIRCACMKEAKHNNHVYSGANTTERKIVLCERTKWKKKKKIHYWSSPSLLLR